MTPDPITLEYIDKRLDRIESIRLDEIGVGEFLTTKQVSNILGYASENSWAKYIESWDLKQPNIKGHKKYKRSQVLKLRNYLLKVKQK